MKKSFFAFILVALLTSFSTFGCGLSEQNKKANSANEDKIETGIKNYNVKFEANGGTRVDTLKISKLTAAPSTSKEGYLFEGWYLDQGLTVAAIYPMDINEEVTLYAKWLRVFDQQRCVSTDIKMFFDGDLGVTYDITPNGFDLETLAKRGYTITISVTYEVWYVKEYDIPWDIGYAGAPQYEAYILNSDDRGRIITDISTRKTAEQKEISYTSQASSLINEKIRLKFSTDNIQNRIYFDNILVTYRCYE